MRGASSEGDTFDTTFAYAPLVDGEVFHFGDMDTVVRSVATSGHTPESTSLEVDGKYLLTGDAVFVSGVGRPDLVGQTVPWAKDLFATIRDILAPLDADLEVLPAYYTNRLESREDGTLRRNLGDLLENDPVVSMTDEDEFVAYVVDHLGDSPSEYGTIRLINLGVKKATAEEISELEVGRNECALSK